MPILEVKGIIFQSHRKTFLTQDTCHSWREKLALAVARALAFLCRESLRKEAVEYNVYIMTNKPRGTLYIGVTGNLKRRTWEHRNGLVEGFTKKYNLKKLVYFEGHDYVYHALQREKTLKHWKREWKIQIIEDINPQWNDLWEIICSL